MISKKKDNRKNLLKNLLKNNHKKRLAQFVKILKIINYRELEIV